jgi:hypothetical protein
MRWLASTLRIERALTTQRRRTGKAAALGDLWIRSRFSTKRTSEGDQPVNTVEERTLERRPVTEEIEVTQDMRAEALLYMLRVLHDMAKRDGIGLVIGVETFDARGVETLIHLPDTVNPRLLAAATALTIKPGTVLVPVQVAPQDAGGSFAGKPS